MPARVNDVSRVDEQGHMQTGDSNCVPVQSSRSEH